MARVELNDIRVPLSASLAGLNTNTAQDAPAAGVQAVGGALSQVAQQSGATFERLGREFVQRRNEREYTQEQISYWETESELLTGEGGALTQQGEEAMGVTERTLSRMNDYITKRAKELAGNPVVRDEFLQFSAKQLAQTRNVVSAHEAARAEDLRVSAATAARATVLRNTTTMQPQRFLPTTLPDGTTIYADPDLIEEVESKTEMINRGWSDAQVSEETRAIIADQAAQSIFYMLDKGPQNLAAAKDIANAYEGHWDATTRAAVMRRVDTELTYDMMDPIVARSAAAIMDSGQTITAKRLSEASVDAFKSDYKAAYGEMPPDEAVQEVRRRSIAQVNLIEDDIQKRHEAARGADMVNFIKTAAKGDPKATEAEARRLIASAHGERDLAFASTLLKFADNSKETGSVHPKTTTAEGLAAVLGGLDGKTAPELVGLAADLSAQDFEDHVGPLLGLKGRLPKNSEIGAALDRARNIYEGKGPFAKTAAADKSGEYASKFQQMTDLSRLYFEQNQRLPTTDELNEIALSTFFSLDDDYYDAGAGDSLGQFLLNPSDSPLDVADTRDRHVLTLVTDAVRLSPRMRDAALSVFPGASEITPELLATNPQVAAELIEVMLVTNAPVFKAKDGSEAKFRSVLKSALEAK